MVGLVWLIWFGLVGLVWLVWLGRSGLVGLVGLVGIVEIGEIGRRSQRSSLLPLDVLTRTRTRKEIAFQVVAVGKIEKGKKVKVFKVYKKEN